MERAGPGDTCSPAERVVTGGQHLYPHLLMGKRGVGWGGR